MIDFESQVGIRDLVLGTNPVVQEQGNHPIRASSLEERRHSVDPGVVETSKDVPANEHVNPAIGDPGDQELLPITPR